VLGKRGLAEQLRQFVEQSCAAMWIVNAATRGFDYRNPRHIALAAIRLDGGPMLNLRDWGANIVEADRAAVAACYEAVFVGATEQHEYRVRDVGRTFSLHLRETVFPIKDGDGRVTEICGITERLATVPDRRLFFIGASEGSAAASAEATRDSGPAIRSFGSIADFLHLSDFLAPACVLIDLNTVEDASDGRMQTLFACRETLPVVVIGRPNTDAATAIAAMRAGAVDYLLPPFTAAELDRALHLATMRIGAPPAELALTSSCNRVEGLSHRELEVLAGLRAGGTNKSIGRDLGISPRTVESHRSRLMERMNARNLAELLQAVQ
jgi:FixJ family two-component response regulator